MTTETLVIIILLAGFIYGAVATSTGRDACQPAVVTGGNEEDGDDAGTGTPVVVTGGSSRACALTKGATGMTVRWRCSTRTFLHPASSRSYHFATFSITRSQE
jgi:hypothetical protein